MFIRKGIRYVFMDQAGGGEGGGAGGSSPAGGAEVAAHDAAATPPAAASGTILAQGIEGQTPVIPEKYQVKKEDGSIDIEASSLKLAEAYGHLEKRLGSGDLPPKTDGEYQVTLPEAFKDLDLANDEGFLSFRKSAHAAGLSQKQFDFVMQQYFDVAPKLVGGAQQLSADECTAELQKEWKSPEQYKAEIGKAYKAAVAYCGDDAQAVINDYGNDPRIIRALAKIGAEIGEDNAPQPQSLPGGSSIESMMTSEAYTNPKHPDHARVSKQVADFYEQQTKGQSLVM